MNPASLKWALAMYEKACKLPGMTIAQIERVEMCAQSIRYALLEIGKSPIAGPDWYFNNNQAYYQELLKDFMVLILKNGPSTTARNPSEARRIQASHPSILD